MNTNPNSTYAKKVFDNYIAPQFISNFSAINHGNIWRTAWAFDTLIDYFCLVDQSQAATISSLLFTASPKAPFDATNGEWWDDFGWAGIASLRAVEKLRLDAATKANFVKMAINCWAYMYGPGWSVQSPQIFSIPFPELPGWDQRSTDVGALNVYQYWINNPGQFPNASTYQPRYTPGGLWNTAIASSHHPLPDPPTSSEPICSDINGELAAIQNTVTNGLFTVLSLRLYQLSQNPAYATYFSNVNTAVTLQAWQNQLSWFSQCFRETIPHASLMMQNGNAVLIRERVALLNSGKWSANYCSQLAWAGDQGLLIGALREAEAFWNSGHGTRLNGLPTPASIINGVDFTSWSSSGYPSGTALVLRPWVQYERSINSSQFNCFPQGDSGDYQTGCAVYLRYLLQAVQAGVTLPTVSQRNILQLAFQLSESRFNNMVPNVICDGFVPQNSQSCPNWDNPADYFTPWINQLALMCVALQIG